MGGIYARGSKLWIWYADASGKRVFEATTAKVGEEDRARKILHAIERTVAAEKGSSFEAGPATLKAFGETWLKGRPGQGVTCSADEAGHLRNHVWPDLGATLLRDLRPRHVRDLVHSLRGKASKHGGALAPRTIRTIYATLHRLLKDAVVDELIATSPCILKRGDLPRAVDKDPQWRQGAVFSREEVEALVSDERVPDDRRVAYGLLFLAGLRFGESAALRWRHFEPELDPLGRLLVTASWNAKARTEGTTKTEAPRAVPVHPTLAKILAAWKLSGWSARFGGEERRAPGPDDLLLPNRWGTHKSPQRALRRFHEDLDRLGLRQRRQHDLRRTFVTLARADGASKDILHWVSHGPRAGDIDDLYSSLPWATLCAEVAKLRIELRAGAEIIPLRAASGAEPCDSPCDSPEAPKKKPQDLATLGLLFSERETRFELATRSLGSCCSTS